MLLPLIAALMAAVSVAALVVALSWRNESTISRRLRQFQSGVSGEEEQSSSILSQKRLGLFASDEARLAIARHPMGLQATSFFALKALAAVGLPLALVWPVLVSPAGIGFNQVFSLVALAILGFKLPGFWLSRRITARSKEIERLLPDALDLITVCVEAGLSIDAALQRVVEKWRGPLSDELHETLREIGLGRPRREALRNLSQRSGVPDINSLVVALVQGEQMGVSLGRVLRVQSEQVRMKRRQRAEKAAQKAPIKMLIPLVTCIFPAMFVVILGPAVIGIGKVLGR